MRLRMWLLMNDRNDNLSFLDTLAIFSVLLQIVGYHNDISQSSNDDLMRELQIQDKKYFEKIIKNQNKILELLQALSPNG